MAAAAAMIAFVAFDVLGTLREAASEVRQTWNAAIDSLREAASDVRQTVDEAIAALREAASDVLRTLGAGLPLLVLWALAVIGLLLARRFGKFRRLRYALGVSVLAAASFAVLSYFEAELPLIGEAALGGSVGEQVRGGDGLTGLLRTAALVIAGAWIVFPALFNRLGKGAGKTASVSGHALKSAARAGRSGSTSHKKDRVGWDKDFVEREDNRAWYERTRRPNPADRLADSARPAPSAAENRPWFTALGRKAPPKDAEEKKPLQPTVLKAALLRDEEREQKEAAPPAPPPDQLDDARGVLEEAAPASEQPDDGGGPLEEAAPASEQPDDVRGPLEEALALVFERVDDGEEEEEQQGESESASEHSDDSGEQGSGGGAAIPLGPARPQPDDGPFAEDDADLDDSEQRQLEFVIVPPSLDLLAAPVAAVAVSEEHRSTGREIEAALAQYGVEVQVNEIRPGPSVTMYGLVPGWKTVRPPDEQADRGSRVKVSSILARRKDLAFALRAPDLRVEEVPGESLINVEVPGVEDVDAAADQIVSTLAEHGVEVIVKGTSREHCLIGLEPGWNRRARPALEAAGPQSAGNRVRVQSILAREKDLALALAAPSLRIQAPVPGESIVGIEVPNKTPSLVTIRTVMESAAYEGLAEAGGLPVALGLAPAGEPVAIDLTKMPHLLIAGSTGSGKSVCINTIISSLIKDQPPSKVRMLLVDPKRVELTPYNGIPHLVTPVVVEPDRVVRLLRGAVEEMNRRYRLLEEAGVRNIQSYNKSPRRAEFLPFFVICIDELADLMMTAPADVETCLVRLAQLSRAVGIHLVVATQRPSVNVITGLIKANFPSRIAFYVASQVDSRTILDFGGAESLLGRGDMLFLSSDSPKARRVQGVFISEEETEALSEHWRQQPPDPNLQEIPLEEMAYKVEAIAAEAGAAETSFDEGDSLYDRALQLAAANRQISTSLLQRRLRIGYPRAARLMDQLEDEGVVAASGEPGKPRDVIYIPDD